MESLSKNRGPQDFDLNGKESAETIDSALVAVDGFECGELTASEAKKILESLRGDGGIRRVRLSCANGSVEIYVDNEIRTVVLTITDNGDIYAGWL